MPKAATATRRRRRWGLKLVLLGFSLGAGVLMIEGLMHLAGLTFPLLWEPDPQIGWKHIPGARQRWREEGDGLVEINSLGQRDRERTLERTPGTLRIAVFGDSLTEALQVDLDETFCQLLEKRLDTGAAGKVEVLNFGVSGYSAVQDLVSLRLNGPRYRPDVAVLALFIDNDVAGCHPKLNATQGAPPYARFQEGVQGVELDTSRCQRSYADYHAQPKYFLRRFSCLYRLLGKWRSQRLGRLDAGEAGAADAVPRRFLLYEKSPGPEWEEAWRDFGRVVEEFIGEAERQGIRPVVLSVPAAQVVVEASWKSILDRHPAMAERQWHPDGPEERLAALLAAEDVPFAQPYRLFRERLGGEPLFFGNVGHLTAAGHVLIADALEALLRSRPGLLAPSDGG